MAYASIEKRNAHNAQYYARNKDAILRQQALWAQNNRTSTRMKRQRYVARRKNAVVEQITPDQIHSLWLGVCTYCLRAMCHDAAHLDHWIPLAKGGSHAIGNLSFMHAACNQRKNATLMSVPLRMRQLEIMQMVGEF